MSDDMMNGWNAYDHLMDVTTFCNQADEHIKKLIENQAILVQTMNDLRSDLNLLSTKLQQLEDFLEVK